MAKKTRISGPTMRFLAAKSAGLQPAAKSTSFVSTVSPTSARIWTANAAGWQGGKGSEGVRKGCRLRAVGQAGPSEPLARHLNASEHLARVSERHVCTLGQPPRPANRGAPRAPTCGGQGSGPGRVRQGCKIACGRPGCPSEPLARHPNASGHLARVSERHVCTLGGATPPCEPGWNPRANVRWPGKLVRGAEGGADCVRLAGWPP